MPALDANDPRNYEKLSKPYPSKTDATAAVSGFFVDVLKARQKWKIADAVVVCGVAVEGEASACINMYRMGSSSITAVLLHRGMGEVMKDMIDDIEEAMKALEDKTSHE